MNKQERERVIQDLTNWKVEYEMWEITEDEILDWRRYLRDMDDENLSQTWYGCVGEWILTRDDSGGSFEWVDEQFEIVKSGGSTDYGYL